VAVTAIRGTRRARVRRYLFFRLLLILAFLALSILILVVYLQLSHTRAELAQRRVVRDKQAQATGQTLNTLRTQVNGLATNLDSVRDQVKACADKKANTPGCTVPVAPPASTIVKSVTGAQGAPGATGATGAVGPGPTDAQVRAMVVTYCALHDNCRGIPGTNGTNGAAGASGADGQAGGQGPSGKDGKDGENGKDGKDGVSVSDAHVDDNCHLIITLSNGDTHDAGYVCGSILP
jgi:hypothetical protein